MEHCQEELNAAGRARVGNPAPGSTFQYMGRTYRFGDKVPELYPDARMDVYDPGYRGHAKGGIVTKAHLGLVGEAGPEAIIPLRGKSLGHTINVSAPVTISGLAPSDIVAALRDHARLIAQEVGRVLEDDHMSLAAI